VTLDPHTNFGELPTEWKTSRIKWILKALESGRREVDENNTFEGQVLSIGGEHIGWHGEWYFDNPRYISFEQYEALTSGKIQPNDVLLVKDGATIGKVAIAEKMPSQKMAVNEHVFILRFSNSDYSKYYFYVLQSSLAQDQIQLEVRGSAQPGLNSEFRQTLVVPHPPLVKQKAISSFLDSETARVDSLIAAKERLLELLEEKRLALITHAVTKGLDSTAQMRDSGVPWIGEIPNHWVLSKLKFMSTKIGSGKTPRGGSEAYVQQGVPLIRSQNVLMTGLQLDDVVFIDEETDEDMSNSRVFPEDVLLNITGASIGRSCVVPAEISRANVNQHVCVIRPESGKIQSEFLNYFLMSGHGQHQIFSNEEGISRESLSFEKVGTFLMPVPPLSEQQALVQRLSFEIQKFNKLTSETHRTISLLKERRASLIAEAVTGKISICS